MQGETCPLGEGPRVIWAATLKDWMQHQQLLWTAQQPENAFQSFGTLQLQWGECTSHGHLFTQNHHSWHWHLVPKVGQTHVWYLLFPPGAAQLCCLPEPAPLPWHWEAACQHMPQVGVSLPLCVLTSNRLACDRDSWTGWVRVWVHRNDSLLWENIKCKSTKKGTTEENPILLSCTGSRDLPHPERQLRKLSCEIIHVK